MHIQRCTGMLTPTRVNACAQLHAPCAPSPMLTIPKEEIDGLARVVLKDDRIRNVASRPDCRRLRAVDKGGLWAVARADGDGADAVLEEQAKSVSAGQSAPSSEPIVQAKALFEPTSRMETQAS